MRWMTWRVFNICAAVGEGGSVGRGGLPGGPGRGAGLPDGRRRRPVGQRRHYAHHSGAVQVDPIKPTLKPPGTKL
jgi:hypothetical protein